MGRINWRKGRASLTLFSGLFLLFAMISPALGATPEIEAVRQAITNKGARWISDETSITKLSPERRLKRLGLRKITASSGTPLAESSTSASQSVTYLNYNDSPYEYVTPIRDQGDCGACWAFATTAALESQVLMSTHVDPSSVDLSEQILLSCSGAGNCESGGYINEASNFIEDTGLPPETCFPYTATDNKCSNASCPYWQSDTDAISSWRWVSTNSPTTDAIKNALLTYGPLVTTMNVYSDFYSYAGGVYSYVSGTLQGSHAIEIIGYDDTNQCFIVKNSWGTGWGEAGFFRIAYSELNDRKVQFGYDTMAYSGYKALQTSCSSSISPTSITATASGGNAKIYVTSQSGCSWTAVSNTKWLKIVSGASGTGDGTVKYRVKPNGGSLRRTGTLTIGGQTFTVTQRRNVTAVW